MNGYSNFKKHFLKSGLPLEATIAFEIDEISSKFPKPLINHGECFFQRDEVDFPHSVDFMVTHDLDLKDCDFVQIAFLLECKYSTRGTKWCFMYNPSKDAGEELFVENFFSHDKCRKANVHTTSPPLNDKSIPIVGKGISVNDGGKNQHTITNGIHQLMFASANQIGRAFVKEETVTKSMKKRGIDINGRGIHSIVVPVLITTSDLHFLTVNNVEEIETSNKLEDVTKAQQILLYSTPNPPNYVKKYILENVFQSCKNNISNEPSVVKRAEIFLRYYSLFFPSRYYIINYKNFSKFVTRYISFASKLLEDACKGVVAND